MIDVTVVTSATSWLCPCRLGPALTGTYSEIASVSDMWQVTRLFIPFILPGLPMLSSSYENLILIPHLLVCYSYYYLMAMGFAGPLKLPLDLFERETFEVSTIQVRFDMLNCCPISTVSSRILKICWPRWPINLLLNSSDLKQGYGYCKQDTLINVSICLSYLTLQCTSLLRL